MKRIGFLLFYLCPFIISAQEQDIFKMMLKESLKPELPSNFYFDFSDSIFSGRPARRLDAANDYIPRMGYKEIYLFRSYREDSPVKPQTISPYLTAPYTNQEKFDPNSTETTNDVIANVVLTPLASIAMINPVGLFDYLMRIGVLPNEPFVPKKSKKERMLKTITKDVYHIDDDY